MKCLFIYNPKSGKEKILNNIVLVANRLKEKFDVVDIHASKSIEDFNAKCYEACGKYDYLIFSGGDGTFNMVINAISNCEERPILGYIPSGTRNDIASNLKLPKNVNKCLDIILNNDYIYHDITKVNDKYFMYVAGVGDFTSLSYNTDHNLKKVFGRIAYYFNGIRSVLHGQRNIYVELEENGNVQKFSTPLLLIVNSHSIAGLKFNKSGYKNDGKVDIFIVKGSFLRGLFNVLNLFIFGILNINSKKISDTFRLEKFKIKAPSYALWCLDGEQGDYGSLEVECIHNHIRVITNNYD